MSGFAAQVAALVGESDAWRCAQAVRPAAARSLPYKEWQHFVVFGADWVLLFNLNLDDDLERVGQRNDARVITILSAAEWQGQVRRCARPDIGLGRIDATFGDAGMCWRDGRYEIWQHGPGVRLEVSLEPVAVPSLTHNIRLGRGSYLSWCMVPRLRASGWVEAGGRRTAFRDLGAYHDHNWGRFAWGGDFSWEWGCALPEDPADPWTLVFARMNSRDRQRTTARSAFLLHRGEHIRYFRDAQVRFVTRDGAHSRAAGRIPPAAALFLPDEDHDVPCETEIEAHRENDWLHARIEAGQRGQVLVPSEADLRGVVRLNEVDAAVQVEGDCAGHRLAFAGRGLMEVVCA